MSGEIMTKEMKNESSENSQEEIYMNLTRLLSRTDIASNSFVLSSVAMQCDEKLLEEFLNDKPPTKTKTLKDLLQGHLYTAAFWGFCDVMSAAINYGADINHKNKGTLWTPLHAACFQEHEKAVEMLLQKGASVRSKDKNGRTCIDFAAVSSKIWPYFSQLKCERPLESDLIRKGLMRSRQTDDSVSTLNSSRLNSSSSQMRTLLGGDMDSEHSSGLPTPKLKNLQIK